MIGCTELNINTLTYCSSARIHNTVITKCSKLEYGVSFITGEAGIRLKLSDIAFVVYPISHNDSNFLSMACTVAHNYFLFYLAISTLHVAKLTARVHNICMQML